MRVNIFHQQDVCSALEAAGRYVPVNGWSWPDFSIHSGAKGCPILAVNGKLPTDS